MQYIKSEIVSRELNGLLNELLFEGTPFVFGASTEQYREWRLGLATRIDIDPLELVVVGSAATGYSLAPRKNLKQFDSDSDIDLAIVSEHLLAEAWHQLRTLDPVAVRLTKAEREALDEHAGRYVYWGCIAVNRRGILTPLGG